MRTVAILSGGAAQGLVAALAPQFEGETGCRIVGTFGAVGAMRDKLAAGAPADILILTAALIAELTHERRVVKGSAADLGTVHTAIAVREGDRAPPVGDADALRVALLEADEVFFPDPERATAGIHFANLVKQLGIDAALRDRLRPYPNGAAAMRALALAQSARPIGSTQVTEILNTPGAVLAGTLPAPHGLATVYTAALCAEAAEPEHARRFIDLLAGDAARDARERAGFV